MVGAMEKLMSMAGRKTEWIEETKAKIAEIGLRTGSFYKDDQGELCASDDETVNGHTYAAVTTALQSGTITGDRKEVMDLVKDMIDLPV